MLQGAIMLGQGIGYLGMPPWAKYSKISNEYV
jgi:hypothetical protein